MEDRLMQYRRRKRFEQFLRSCRACLRKPQNGADVTEIFETDSSEEETDPWIHELNEVEDTYSDAEEQLREEKVPSSNSIISMFILWLSLFCYFIYLEVGAIYFSLSLLVIIYYNTRTGKKSANEVSAYSVFNKNFERIDGTLNAEDFDRQIRSGVF